MTFLLSRTAKNVPAEVQRWQYFLLRQGIAMAGQVDGDFGPKSETATKIFQMTKGLSQTGKLDRKTLDAALPLGYTELPDNYYKDRSSFSWPPPPAGLASPSNAWRNATFECFAFKKPTTVGDNIIIGKNCSGTKNDWVASNITDLKTDAFGHVPGYSGYIRCHVLAAPRIDALLAAWRAADLLHLVVSYAGAFVPRYIRKNTPTPAHGTKQSTAVSSLSNHAFGTAFDINATENWLGDTPAQCGQKGAVRELVEIANGLGLFWGGHYSTRLDGMHFELAN